MIVRWNVLRAAMALAFLVCSLPCTRSEELFSLNGWHPCSLDIGNDSSLVSDIVAECATVTMPLCHSEVCSTENEPLGRTVELFVKRIPAKSATSTRNLWFIPDHPFTMSVEDAERQMILLYQQLVGDVSVYVMDQRGTGRSTPSFDCEASQATSPVSNETTSVAASEVPSCVSALRSSFGDQFAQAFSLTSAARDLVTFISHFQANTKVSIYGVGFGTHLVERVMHFPSNEIIGFVLDSVATTSGGKLKEFPFLSKRDQDFGEAAEDFLSLCDRDNACKARFNGTELAKVLEGVLQQLDGGACPRIAASLLKPASLGLRQLLAAMIQDPSLRLFIPVVVYRLHRCDTADVQVLEALIAQVRTQLAVAKGSSSESGASQLVFDLIQFSELWESPSPSESELLARFNKTLISPGLAATGKELERYCAFTQDDTSACSAFSMDTKDEQKPLRYSRDTHWNAAAVIPSQASVLMLSSRFDGQTPVEYATVLFDALSGDSKERLVFETASHNVLATSSPLMEDEDRSLEETPSCARTIVASYIDNDGDLKSYDVSCMATLPSALSLQISQTLSQQVLGVTEPYDGVLLPSSQSGSRDSSSSQANTTMTLPPSQASGSDIFKALEQSRNRYRLAFFLLLVLGLVLLVVVVLVMYKAYKRQLLQDEELQLRKLRGEGEEDDMEFLRDLYNPSPSEWFNFRSNRLHL